MFVRRLKILSYSQHIYPCRPKIKCSLNNLLIGFAFTSVLLLLTRRLFHRMQANFVEEL